MGRFSEAILLLLLGVVMGPDGISVLSSEALAFVDPAMPVALVALGILVGLEFGTRRRTHARLLTAASTESVITAAVVAAGFIFAAPLLPTSPGIPYWLVALVLGVCAASSAPALSRPDDDSRAATGIGDLDALFPIALGGVALALLRAPSLADAIFIAVQACGAALVIVLAAWLLISRSPSETEQRVFTAALLLLLGGAADYLSLSALLSGLIAGVFFDRIGGPARDAMSRTVLQFQRPLIALVLIVTGARVDLEPAWLGLALVYLLLRTGAKLAGGWAARRVVRGAADRELGSALLSPGILGIAFALNVVRATGPDGTLILAVATLGSVASDVIAVLASPVEAAE